MLLKYFLRWPGVYNVSMTCIQNSAISLHRILHSAEGEETQRMQQNAEKLMQMTAEK